MFNKDLKLGDKGIDVVNLQNLLKNLGYFNDFSTGYFGPVTRTAVINYQRQQGIDSVGVVGPITRKSLNALLNDKKDVYQTALSCIGTDASPSDLAPDEVGCAETVSDILIKSGVKMPVIISTYQLYRFLLSNSQFVMVDVPKAGDIIISPTGYGNGQLPNGHTGIVGEDGKIMSNNSNTGLFSQNYTLDSWKKRYQILGGYPGYFFKVL